MCAPVEPISGEPEIGEPRNTFTASRLPQRPRALQR
jgi:hypothetical protein